MTLILTEGFETYVASADLLLGVRPKWTTGSSVDLRSNTPRTGARHSRAHALHKRVDVADEHATMVVGFAMRAGYNVAGDLVRFLSDDGATLHGGLSRNVGGTADLFTGTSTVVATTPNPVFDSSVWQYYEVVFVLGDAGGSIDFYMNSDPTPVLSFSGDTKIGGTKTVLDKVIVIGPSFQEMDDIYILNGAGAAPLNDRIGEVKCFPLAPSGNGTTNQGVGSDGNSTDNYLLVDEPALSLNAGDYVDILTDGDKDLYAYGNLVPTTGSILNVEAVSQALKTDTGAKSLRHRVRSGGSEATGPDGALAQTRLPVRDQFFLNPVTAADWTIAEVNAMEVGWEARP